MEPDLSLFEDHINTTTRKPTFEDLQYLVSDTAEIMKEFAEATEETASAIEAWAEWVEGLSPYGRIS